jgi:hypothetical protein
LFDALLVFDPVFRGGHYLCLSETRVDCPSLLVKDKVRCVSDGFYLFLSNFGVNESFEPIGLNELLRGVEAVKVRPLLV